MSTDKRVQDEGFILHNYPYQETSLILDVFTRHHGRVGLVAKGARRPRGALRGVLRQFQVLRLEWFGRAELRTLASAEWVGALVPLHGRGLLCGFYVNELILKLTARDDAHEHLFDMYRDLLPQLLDANGVEPLLRTFELALLRELGYAMTLTQTGDTRCPVTAEASYGFACEVGPLALRRGADQVEFRGKTLLDMEAGEYGDPVTLLQSKQLMRMAIAHYLNGQPLHTRQLLKDLQAL